MENERVSVQLSLKSGTLYYIIARGMLGSLFVSHIRELMQLSAIKLDKTKGERTSAHPYLRRLFIIVDSHAIAMSVSGCISKVSSTQDSIDQAGFVPKKASSSIRSSEVQYVFCPSENENALAPQLKISMIIALHSQRYEALLLHGALAAIDKYGVILAGSGGAGKTTASNRLPIPWRSLCDDTTLVVKDRQGKYWAHPWPTWSKIMLGEANVSWDVQQAVPLVGIFYLSRSQGIQIDPVGSGKAACMLAESAEQASLYIPHVTHEDHLREHLLERFDNACSLARSVPCYTLHLNLHDPFWHEIEQAIGYQRENVKH
jgi:SynChlorMet cassette protein ScmC